MSRTCSRFVALRSSADRSIVPFLCVYVLLPFSPAESQFGLGRANDFQPATIPATVVLRLSSTLGGTFNNTTQR